VDAPSDKVIRGMANSSANAASKDIDGASANSNELGDLLDSLRPDADMRKP